MVPARQLLSKNFDSNYLHVPMTSQAGCTPIVYS
jgi:hypothetical protein